MAIDGSGHGERCSAVAQPQRVLVLVISIMPSFSSELRSSFGTPGRACKNLKSLGPTYFVASEASIHSLRAEAAKLARTNKAKFYLHSARRKSSSVAENRLAKFAPAN